MQVINLHLDCHKQQINAPCMPPQVRFELGQVFLLTDCPSNLHPTSLDLDAPVAICDK